MKISTLIEKLAEIQEKYGDIPVTGGAMMNNAPLQKVCVTDTEGREVYPNNVNGLPEPHEIDGVFFE